MTDKTRFQEQPLATNIMMWDGRLQKAAKR